MDDTEKIMKNRLSVRDYSHIAIRFITLLGMLIIAGSVASMIVTAPYLLLLSGVYDYSLRPTIVEHEFIQLVGWYQVAGSVVFLLFASHVRAEFKRWNGEQCGYPTPWLFVAASLLPLVCSVHFLFFS